MKKLLELRQQKSDLNHQMRSLLTKAEIEKRSLTSDESKQFDELRHYVLTGESRSLSTGVPSDGGYTVIPGLNKKIMQQLTDESVMRRICSVKTTRGNEYKQLVSVGGAAVAYGEEGKARTETATPKMEEVSIKLFPIYAYPKTTQEIIDFSDVDILGRLTAEIADTFVDTEETDLVSGDGSKKAKGFLSYPRDTQADKIRAFGTLQKLEVATLEADSLIDLKFLLKNKYRNRYVSIAYRWIYFINSPPVILCHPAVKTCNLSNISQSVLSNIDEPILLMFTGGVVSHRLHVI
ncbi:phage major capsid protein [Xenorhabdus littoralis]|uniref:phage major capsid protein n=1 Tax=Xenorhabdus littoralis TaxID=2582835 RepID=UPI0029E803DF|nr:phage major capsid protein [Xenorhabdus sp. psl]MDX7990862.1 phage major capsid protein [Xenorhabdus sp. psl]